MNQTPAQVRNAAARRLMARRRFREALDILNEAIRLDPRYAESYDNRAVVFENLGMYPQADADRRKVAELGGVIRSPAAVQEVPGVGQPAPPMEAAQPPPRYPLPPRRRGGAGPALRALGTVLITLGLFAAAGIGIFIALNTLSDALNDDDEVAVAPTGTAGASETPGATGDGQGGDEVTPTPAAEAPEEALQGSPFSFSRLDAAWREKSIESSTGGISQDLGGFRTSPVDVTLSRGGVTLAVAVLLYDGGDALNIDWDKGASVTPKEGRTIPAGSRVLYNQNAVVVVRDPDSEMYADLRDAFLGLAP